MLLAAEHPRGDAGLLQTRGDFARHQGHGRPLRPAQLLQPPDDGVASARVDVLEGQLLQLRADAVAADRARQGGVDLQRLARDALALLDVLDEAEGAHVVQAVGQLDHQHPHVARDGQDELAQVLRLADVLGVQLQARQLGHALDQFADLFAEHLVDVLAGGGGVLDHVVQQGRDDGRGVQLVVGEDAGHLDRVGEIGVAGGARLAAVHAHGVDVGAVQQGLVGRRVVALDPFDQLILAQEARPRGRLERRGRQSRGDGRRRLYVGRSGNGDGVVGRLAGERF